MGTAAKPSWKMHPYVGLGSATAAEIEGQNGFGIEICISTVSSLA